MDCREGLARTARDCMGQRRSSFIATTLVAISLVLAKSPVSSSACLYERAVLPNWSWGNSTYDEDFEICDNTVLFSRDFVTPIYEEDDPDYAENLYVRYKWTVDAECQINLTFNAGSETRPIDKLHVYEGNAYYAYHSTFPTTTVVTDDNSINMYFISQAGTPTEVGFTGNLKESCSEEEKRRRRSIAMAAPDQQRKLSTSNPASGRPGYRGRIANRENIPLMMDMWKAKLVSDKTVGELCDHSCDVRLLLDMPECCQYWHENLITPTSCPGRVNVEESDLATCPPQEPLGAGRLRKRSLAEQRVIGRATGDVAADNGWRDVIKRIFSI